ncbi:MAG: DNA polymerase IV [Tissierellia bacterium]|nr:DNA polymerase IV [Tissierellia bacterium]
MTHKIFHIDVNSAYLSWEAAYQLQHGATLDLRTIPSIVGGDIEKRHGIVLAKSIPAKKYGIQTGESVASAKLKCPELISIPPHYERYVNASNAMVELIQEYSPLVQRYSIDELFMDYFDSTRDPVDAAEEIKDRIRNELGFTVNVGIGDNKLLAKMASDFQKPDRVHTLYREEIPEKMWPLPIRDLFMVGRRTEKKLLSRGITTIGELAQSSREYLLSWLKKPGLTIWEFANGIESTQVRIDPMPVKSVGNSTTLPFDVRDRGEADMVLLAISEMVGMRLRSISMRSAVIHVGFKDSEFNYYGMERKLYTPTNSTKEIYRHAALLLTRIWNNQPIRAMSVRAGRLSDDTAIQLSLYDHFSEKDENLDETIDHIRGKYGLDSMQKSVFLHSGISPVIGGVIREKEYPLMSSLLT